MTHSHGNLIDRSTAVDHALSLRDRTLKRQATETVTIDRVAGRTLANAVHAEFDVPDNDYATMDGYAFDVTDDYPLTILDEEVFPEATPPSIEAGQAVRIATGAPLPERANGVLKEEDAQFDGDQLAGKSIVPGTYTYGRGSNVEAGERLFESGERLGPKDAILLRDIGYEAVTARTPFSVGILATGTEIHEGRTADLDSPMLAGLVRSWGHNPVIEGTIPDEYEAVETAITDLAERRDVVLTTGGTSVGNKDYVVRALRKLGEVRFHRVGIRPGKPIAGAVLPKQDAVVFAIPGKPIGAYTSAVLVARPFFTGIGVAPTLTATLKQDVDMGVKGFEYAVPVILEDGSAIPLGHIDSPLALYEREFDPSVLSSSTKASRADGIVLTEGDLTAGETVAAVPYDALL